MTPEELQQNAHEALIMARLTLESARTDNPNSWQIPFWEDLLRDAKEALYAPKTPTQTETFPEGLPF